MLHGEVTKQVVGFVLVKCSDMPPLNPFEMSSSERPCVRIPTVSVFVPAEVFLLRSTNSVCVCQ